MSSPDWQDVDYETELPCGCEIWCGTKDFSPLEIETCERHSNGWLNVNGRTYDSR